MGTVDSELKRPEPNRERLAGALGRIAALLKGVGRLADSVNSFSQLAAFLGPAGAGLIALLV